MRLKSEIWVQAYLRICAVAGVPAVLSRRGDADGGAIYVRVDRLDGTCAVYGPAPAGLDGSDLERRFVGLAGGSPVGEARAGELLAEQLRYDPDLWIVEVEDRQGRHFLGDWLLPPAV